MIDREERDLVARKLRALGWTYVRIGAEIGCTPHWASKLVRSPQRPQRSCAQCGRTIPGTRRRDAVTCSPECNSRRQDARPWRAQQIADYARENAVQVAAAHRRHVEALQAESRATATSHGCQWTGPELEIITRYEFSTQELALRLGRTYAAVRSMRKKVRDDPRKIQLAGLANTVSPAKDQVA